jgi:hypothetical protein
VRTFQVSQLQLPHNWQLSLCLSSTIRHLTNALINFKMPRTRSEVSIIDDELDTRLQSLSITYDGPSESARQRCLPRGILGDSSDETTFGEEVTVPVYLNSIEALRFIGLKKTAAQEVMSAFLEEYAGEENSRSDALDLITFATGYLADKTDVAGDDEDWMEALKDMGARKSLRCGILDPEFADLRLSRSGKEWFRESMRDAWAFLVGLNKNIDRNLEVFEAKKYKHKGATPKIVVPPKEMHGEIPR